MGRQSLQRTGEAFGSALRSAIQSDRTVRADDSTQPMHQHPRHPRRTRRGRRHHRVLPLSQTARQPYTTKTMDMTWVTDRIAVGGGIWNEPNMRDVANQGVTHIINMQTEFDDRELARPHGLQVLWNAVEDDFQPKPAE